MSAILIANNPPSLKQPVHKTPPKTTPTVGKSKLVSEISSALSDSQPKQEPKLLPEVELEPDMELSPDPEPTIEAKQEPESESVPVALLCTESSATEDPLPGKLSKEVPSAPPSTTAESASEIDEDGGGGTGEEEEEEQVAVPVVARSGRGRRRKRGNSNKFVNIPSIEYPVSLLLRAVPIPEASQPGQGMVFHSITMVPGCQVSGQA